MRVLIYENKIVKNMAEWFERKIISIDELTDDEEKKNILEEIRIKLKSLTTLELYTTASNLDFTRLFKQLTSDDRFVNDNALFISSFTYNFYILKINFNQTIKCNIFSS